jgi:hypothetical protein
MFIAAPDRLTMRAAFGLRKKFRVGYIAVELLDLFLAGVERALFVVAKVALFPFGLGDDGLQRVDPCGALFLECWKIRLLSPLVGNAATGSIMPCSAWSLRPGRAAARVRYQLLR